MIGYLIITGFTAVLLWSLVKVSFSFSDFAKKIADPIFNFAENAVKTASIVPLPGGGMGTLGGIGKTPGLLMNQLSSQMSKNQGAATQQLTDKFYKTGFGKGVQNLSGYDHEKGKMKDISSSEANALQSKLTTAATANNIKGVAAKLQEFAKARLNEGKGVSLESPNFINALNTLLKNDTNFRKQMIDMVKITPAPKDTDLLEFNTKTSTNKKLLTGLMYIMNNPYNTSADRTSIENTIKTQMNGQEIKPNTSLIIGAEGNNTQ